MLGLRLYDLLDSVAVNVTGPLLRRVGKRLAQAGLALQGTQTSDDRIVPSLRCRKFNAVYPSLAQANFVAPNSTVIGNVKVGEKASIWYGATVRGDLGTVQIGNKSIVQDLVTITPSVNGNGVRIGDNVLIGPNSSVENCVIENNCFVGMGSTVRNGAYVQSNSVVAAGAVIPEGAKVGANQIWAGNPAKYLRDLTPEELQVVQEHHDETVELARIHSEQTELTFRQIVDDLDSRTTAQYQDTETALLKKLQELGMPMTYDDEDYIEQRVLLREAKSPKESQLWEKNYDPYEQDLHHFPDAFKIYGDNYERYDELKRYFEQNPNEEAQQINREFNSDNRYSEEPWTRKY